MTIIAGSAYDENVIKQPLSWVYSDDGLCVSLQIDGEEIAMIEAEELCGVADAIHGLNRRSAELRAIAAMREGLLR